MWNLHDSHAHTHAQPLRRNGQSWLFLVFLGIAAKAPSLAYTSPTSPNGRGGGVGDAAGEDGAVRRRPRLRTYPQPTLPPLSLVACQVPRERPRALSADRCSSVFSRSPSTPGAPAATRSGSHDELAPLPAVWLAAKLDIAVICHPRTRVMKMSTRAHSADQGTNQPVAHQHHTSTQDSHKTLHSTNHNLQLRAHTPALATHMPRNVLDSTTKSCLSMP